MTFSRRAFHVTVLVLCHATVVSAQTTSAFDGNPVCRECRIQLTPVAVLGPTTPDGEPVVLSDTPLLYAGESGRLFVGHRTSASVHAFAADGRYLRSFGRSGEGPGEFRSFNGIIDMPGDSVIAVDNALQRLTLYDSRLNSVAVFKTPFGFASDIVRLGNLLIVNPSRAYQRSGGGRSPIQAIDRNGAMVRSFGRPDPESPGRPLATLRAFSSAPNGRFWAGHKGEYRIERWTAAGTLERVFTRSIPEFPRIQSATCGPDWVPPATLHSIQQIGGYLWVVLHVGDKEWRRGTEILGREGGCPALNITDYSSFVDTWIEVWDISRGTVVARSILDQHILGITRSGLLSAVGYQGDDVVVKVYRPQLVQPR